MKFLWTTINVKNMDESIAFYTEMAGLRVMNRFPAGPGMEIAFLGNGTDNESLIELLVDAKMDSVNFTECVSVGFAMDSVETMLDKVRQHNIPVQSGPVETPGGSKFFCIKDPNGLNVQFFQQV